LTIQELVANRVRAYYQAQDKSKKYLNKHKAQSGSDFFVETTVFALKLFAEVEGLNLEVASERKKKLLQEINQRIQNLSLLTLAYGEVVLAYARLSVRLSSAIRDIGWLSQFESREEELQVIFPEAKTFLLVMTGCNWSGFDRSEPRAGFDSNDQRVGEKFFCLLGKDTDGKDIWPTWMPEDLSKRHFHHPFEKLLARIQLL
jgi:hypothetical protein